MRRVTAAAMIGAALLLAAVLFFFFLLLRYDYLGCDGELGGQRRAGNGQAWLPHEHHPRLRSGRPERGLLHQGPRLRGHPEGHRVQHRDRGDHGPAGRPARRRLRRAEPGHQRLAEVERQRDQDHLGCRDRRCLDRRREGHYLGHPAQGQDAGDSLARQHAGRRAARLAQAERPGDHLDRRRRRLHQADDAQLGCGARIQVRPDRRRFRARALRHRDGQATAARSCSARPASPPCSS